jgi:hypothetical protein
MPRIMDMLGDICAHEDEVRWPPWTPCAAALATAQFAHLSSSV